MKLQRGGNGQCKEHSYALPHAPEISRKGKALLSLEIE